MGKNKINLLFVDDEEQFLASIGKQLEARGGHVLSLNSGEKAIEAARRHPVDAALIDLKNPGKNEEILKALKQEHPWMEVVILTDHPSIDSAVECIRCGAHSYLQKPCDQELLLEVIKEAYKKRMMNRPQTEEAQTKKLLQDASFGSSMIMSSYFTSL